MASSKTLHLSQQHCQEASIKILTLHSPNEQISALSEVQPDWVRGIAD